MNPTTATFDPGAILATMESLKQPSGGFIAAPSDDYNAVWLRDHLYIVFSYWYLYHREENPTRKREFETNLKTGMQIAFNILHHQRHQKLERIEFDINNMNDLILAQHHPETLLELPKSWAHHQLDAVGLFLYIIADLDFKNFQIIRDQGDREILQLLVFYALNVRYWYNNDFGMWESCKARKSSSIGAMVRGLQYIKQRELAVVPDELVTKGRNDLMRILPNETMMPKGPHDSCGGNHNHECDMAQLSLIWPYNIVPREKTEEILRSIESRLIAPHGVLRFRGDNYAAYKENTYLAPDTLQGWPMGFFWLSIIYSQRNDHDKAAEWFAKGCEQIVDGDKIPEMYVNGEPNNHTPLAWAHAMALIAWCKLPENMQTHFLKK